MFPTWEREPPHLFVPKATVLLPFRQHNAYFKILQNSDVIAIMKRKSKARQFVNKSAQNENLSFLSKFRENVGLLSDFANHRISIF